MENVTDDIDKKKSYLCYWRILILTTALTMSPHDMPKTQQCTAFFSSVQRSQPGEKASLIMEVTLCYNFQKWQAGNHPVRATRFVRCPGDVGPECKNASTQKKEVSGESQLLPVYVGVSVNTFIQNDKQALLRATGVWLQAFDCRCDWRGIGHVELFMRFRCVDKQKYQWLLFGYWC